MSKPTPSIGWYQSTAAGPLLLAKTWFIVLLVLGLFSFGLVAMIAYLIAGPDGTTPTVAQPAQSPA